VAKHEKDTPQEHSGDKEQLHKDIRALPTYQPDPPTPYDKATEKPAKP
jgi:hypothetical protein